MKSEIEQSSSFDSKNSQQDCLDQRIKREVSFWNALYNPPFDIKKAQQDYLDQRPNRQVSLLYVAIKAGATHFLLEECKSWNLKIILSILLPISFKKNFILLDFLYHSQLPLTIQYLIRSRKKSQNLEQKVKNKLLELKDAGFDYLQLPMDELKKIGYWANEKNRSELERKAAEFSTILKILKSILDKDLITYRDAFTKQELHYLKLFLEILFWDKDSNNIEEYKSENFKKSLFDTIQSFTLDTYYKNFIFDKSTHHLKPFYDCYHPKKINGILLGVNIGNLLFLEAYAKEIRTFFSLPSPFSKMINVLPNLSRKLLVEATRKKHAAVVQFLSEQETAAELDTNTITTNHHDAIKTAICSQNYNLIMLNIAHGGVTALEKEQYEFINVASYRRPENIDFLAVIILTQVNISIDVSRDDTFLKKLIKNSDTSLRVIQKNPASRKKYNNNLCYLLETFRFLLILGADPGKIKENREKDTFNNVLKLFREESKSFDTALEKHQISSLNWDSKDYLTHLSKVCFLDNLSKENYSTTTPEFRAASLKFSDN